MDSGNRSFFLDIHFFENILQLFNGFVFRKLFDVWIIVIELQRKSAKYEIKVKKLKLEIDDGKPVKNRLFLYRCLIGEVMKTIDIFGKSILDIERC